MLTKQMDFVSNDIDVKINELTGKYPITMTKKYDEREKEPEITLKLRKNINLYLEELENITGRKVSCHQKEFIKSYIDSNEVYKISTKEHSKKRREFHQNCKNLRSEWEKQTEQDWPKYEQDVYVNGKLWRIRGENYDAHHIIELRFSGPNVWYNIFPAASPFEHPNAIHASGSKCTEIFGDINCLSDEQKKIKILFLQVDEEEDLDEELKNHEERKVTKISKNIIRIH